MKLTAPFEKLLKLQAAFSENYAQKKIEIADEKTRKEINEEFNLCLDNWKRYYKNLEMVNEEELINYYLYMIKAEEARLSYLQKQIKEMQA